MNRILLIAALLPTLALAQDYQGMSQQDMQKMMQGMQQMQSCMQKVNQAEMEAAGKRAEAMQKEVEALCAGGKRDEAQAKGMAFAREMQQNPAMQQMGECGQMMAGMMPASPFLEQIKQSSGESGGSRHICD